jgi:hypothetical protein
MSVSTMHERPVRAGERGDPARRGPVSGRRTFRGPLLGLAVPALGLMLGAAPLSPGAARADIYLGFQSPTFTVAPGDTFTAYLVIQQADAEFNAFDASVRFDPAMLSFEAITPVAAQRGPLMVAACSNTFHIFSAAPDSLRITLSLLCNNTFVTGPGTLYRVRFRAGMTQGVTNLTFGPYTEFYRAGIFTRPLNKAGMVVTVGPPTGVLPARAGGNRLECAPPSPNPRRGSGPMGLEFSLPGPDVVSVEVLDLQGRRVARREAERFDAGPNRLSWSPPALASGTYFVRLRTLASGSVVRRWVALR